MKTFYAFAILLSLGYVHADSSICWQCLSTNAACKNPTEETLDTLSNCKAWSNYNSSITCITVNGKVGTTDEDITYRNCAPKNYLGGEICSILTDEFASQYLQTAITKVSCSACDTDLCNGPSLSVRSGSFTNSGIVSIVLTVACFMPFL